MRESYLERFLRYIVVDTQSNEERNIPSTAKQFHLAHMLRDEMLAMGLCNVSCDDNGYVFAKLPANVDYAVPAIGFIAHMDTAQGASVRM